MKDPGSGQEDALMLAGPEGRKGRFDQSFPGGILRMTPPGRAGPKCDIVGSAAAQRPEGPS